MTEQESLVKSFSKCLNRDPETGSHSAPSLEECEAIWLEYQRLLNPRPVDLGGLREDVETVRRDPSLGPDKSGDYFYMDKTEYREWRDSAQRLAAALSPLMLQDYCGKVGGA